MRVVREREGRRCTLSDVLLTEVCVSVALVMELLPPTVARLDVGEGRVHARGGFRLGVGGRAVVAAVRGQRKWYYPRIAAATVVVESTAVNVGGIWDVLGVGSAGCGQW